MRRKRHDSINRIIAKIGHSSRPETPVPRCRAVPVSFLPQVFRLSGWFLGKSGVAAAGSGPGWPSNRRKYGSVANVAVMKRLPESS